MKDYDCLPREYRDLLKGSFNPDIVNISNYDLMPVEFFANRDKLIQRKMTIETYGIEHPQAQ